MEQAERCFSDRCGRIAAIYQTHLDQRISFLHEPSEGRFSLSLDLSEVFKPVIVFRTIFDLVNNRRLQVEKHFEKKVNYCILNEEGRKIFIEAFENGYDTDIGQRGVKLSGGQKQRLSIARVFLKNPPILIFDEATSALDNESEQIVQESLEKLAKNRTTFVIAHRLTTIENAEEIYMLTDEGIKERGTHKELMELDGEYAHMVKIHSAN